MKMFLSILVFMTLGFSAEASVNSTSGEALILQFSEGALEAKLTWLAGPQAKKESILRIEWQNGADHSPIEPPGEFKVELWMPDMGHGSSPTKIQQVLDQKGEHIIGAYEISRIYFIMGGHWDVNVTLTTVDGVEEAQKIEVEIE